MGLFHMIGDAWKATWQTQMKEYFIGQGLSNIRLVVPGTHVNQSLTSNVNTMLTTGSIFDVGIGQAALIIFNGKIHDCVVATSDKTAGQYRFEEETAPSILADGFHAFIPVAKLIMERMQMSGGINHNATISYVNLRPITNNVLEFKDVPFKESEIGLTVIASGVINYSIQIVNPITFFENCVNDISQPFDLSSGDGLSLYSALRSEVLAGVQYVVSEMFGQGVEYYQMNQCAKEIALRLNKILYDSWLSSRGIIIRDVNLSITLDQESRSRLFKYQEAKIVGSNPTIAQGRLINAYANALENPYNPMGMMMAMSQGNPMAPWMMGQQGIPLPQAPMQQNPDTTNRFYRPGSECYQQQSQIPQIDETQEVHVIMRCEKCGWRPNNINNPPAVCPLCGMPMK